VADDPDTVTGPEGSMLPAGLAAAEAELRLRTSLDLAEIARLVLDASVPDFADAAAVFAIDRLLRGAEPQRSDDTREITARRLGTRIAHEGTRVTQASFPAGEVIAFAADSPYARCVRGEPVVFDRPDNRTLEQERPAGRETMSRYASFLTLPTISGDRTTGLLMFARTIGPAFSDDDVSVAARLAAGAGAGIANALTLLRERSLADTLQRSLLAAEPAVPPGIEVAARCLPAEGQIVGGDWYDIIALPGGRSGVIVGDVMGHGPEAAAVMAQLRAAAHALAQLDPEPAELLGHLDRTTATLQQPALATCVYAVIDPVGQTCTLSTAGHLPPVLAMPDGVTRTPDLPGGQSLGLGSAVYGQARIKLPPGAVIALYTDGLVETRTRSFDQGILALRTALSHRDVQLETACDTLIASLAERYEDDVTVVLARIQRPETPDTGEAEKIRSG
jgi:Stage II sporulation protein E (SpoIIE)/GAF domain